MTSTAASRAIATFAVVAALTLAGCAGSAQDGAAPSSSTPAVTATTSPTGSATTSPTGSATTPAPAPTGPNRITTPADGSTVAGPQIDVTGEGTAFEGTLSWRVLSAGTSDVVAKNFTTAGANGTVGPFTFTVSLKPGTYTLEVWEPNMSDSTSTSTSGTDSRTGLVTSTFTVT